MKRYTMLVAFCISLMAIAITPTFARTTLVRPRSAISVEVISPENRTYTSETLPIDLPLTFYSNTKKGQSWMGYSLDGATNVTVTGDTDLTIESYGKHNVIVYVTVLGTTYAARVDFTVSIIGDLTGDGVVDINDIVLATASYGSRPGNEKWNPEIDLAPIYGIIDIYDMATLAYHYGNTW